MSHGSGFTPRGLRVLALAMMSFGILGCPFLPGDHWQPVRYHVTIESVERVEDGYVPTFRFFDPSDFSQPASYASRFKLWHRDPSNLVVLDWGGSDLSHEHSGHTHLGLVRHGASPPGFNMSGERSPTLRVGQRYYLSAWSPRSGSRESWKYPNDLEFEVVQDPQSGNLTLKQTGSVSVEQGPKLYPKAQPLFREVIPLDGSEKKDRSDFGGADGLAEARRKGLQLSDFRLIREMSGFQVHPTRAILVS